MCGYGKVTEKGHGAGPAGAGLGAVACVRVRGIPVGGYLRGILGDLSVTTMLLLGASVFGVFGWRLLDKGQSNGRAIQTQSCLERSCERMVIHQPKA